MFVLEKPEPKDGYAKEHEGNKDDDDKHEKPNVVFEVRKVGLGIRRDGYVEVTKGLQAGDEIAVIGSHVLKSHLFKDRIGSAEE